MITGLVLTFTASFMASGSNIFLRIFFVNSEINMTPF